MTMSLSTLRFGGAVLLALAAVVAACAKSAAIDTTPAPECAAGEIICGGICTASQTDSENCGACNAVCAIGQACVAGKCATQCPGGDTLCSSGAGKPGKCINARSDNTNCGVCGKACKTGEICFNGACNSTCGDSKSGQTVCGADGGSPYCANLKNDNANCGKCGTACVSGLICSSGACASTCSQDQTQCGGDGGPAFCANLQTDNSHCGDCAVACGVLEACVGGGCVLQCTDSQLLCKASDAGVPYCTDYLSDNNNCGQCGNVCPNNKPLCSGGTCSDGSCNRSVLLLGDTNAASNAGYVSMLQGAGFTVNSTYTTTSYSGSPPANGFGVVIISPGTTYTTDMPVGGQQSVVTAQGALTGVIMTEWAAYMVGNGLYATLKPLLLVPRTSGTTSTLTFTNTVAHPIWNGLPSSFVTTTLGANVGNILNAGAVQIATCTQCTSIGVAVKDQGQGRIVQVAHAAGYSGSWWTDPNLAKMTVNAANWAARCN